MRTSLDFPDPLFKHLKTRAALEGRTLRDLVIELVERGLTTEDAVDSQKRQQARPLIVSSVSQTWAGERPSDAGLYQLVNEDDDARARDAMARR